MKWHHATVESQFRHFKATNTHTLILIYTHMDTYIHTYLYIEGDKSQQLIIIIIIILTYYLVDHVYHVIISLIFFLSRMS